MDTPEPSAPSSPVQWAQKNPTLAVAIVTALVGLLGYGLNTRYTTQEDAAKFMGCDELTKTFVSKEEFADKMRLASLETAKVVADSTAKISAKQDEILSQLARHGETLIRMEEKAPSTRHKTVASPPWKAARPSAATASCAWKPPSRTSLKAHPSTNRTDPMTKNTFRILSYFGAAFFTGFTPAATIAESAKGWILAVAAGLGSGFVALGVYADLTADRDGAEKELALNG